MPKEYGTERRPFSDSPAPPHPNDQFTGLAEGGMHADKEVKPSESGSGSERTLGAHVEPPMGVKPAIKKGAGGNNYSEGEVGSDEYDEQSKYE